ncbi:PAS domain S-box protein [Pelagibacterium montanilacus]|uniref:PAS domain S-box protein n=1 Tax=Pelagibacterium montanilacus TaxID=2185280 RepID=UPI000F8C9788|nr:PAS domain S-box protein [Pelagibacterium montanilacus]
MDHEPSKSVPSPDNDDADLQIDLLRLSDRIRRIESEDEVLRVCATALGELLGLERVGFAAFTDQPDVCEILAEWLVSAGMPAFSGRIDLKGFGPDIAGRLRAGRELAWDDAQARVAGGDPDIAARYRTMGVGAMLNIPIMRDGEVAAFLYAHSAAPRDWPLRDILLARDVCERAWSSLERVRFQAEIGATNARLTMALEAGGLGTWDWDLRHDRLEWSDALFSMLGFAPRSVEPSFALWRDRLHEADREAALAGLERVLDGDGTYDEVFRVVRPDGTTRWCSSRGRLFRSETGQPVRMVGVLEDITSSRASELKLRESEERFRLIVENALGYAIFTTDSEGLIDGWPPGAEAVFGWAPHEVIGRPADILFTPEDRADGAPEWEFSTALREGHSPDIRWHLHKDGTRVFIDGSVWPLRGGGGRHRGFLKIGQDVTARRRHDAVLKASEERFRVLANSVPNLVFGSTARGERTWVSRQWTEYTGLRDAQSAGFGWLQAVHPEDRDHAMEGWEQGAASGAYHSDYRIRRQTDGAYRWHQVRALVLPAPPEEPEEWVGSAADVHDMRMMQENQELLVAELQHRTRNLLGIVRGILAETAGEPELAEFRRSFDKRLGALSRVQGLLSRQDDRFVTLRELVALELQAVSADWEQVELTGPDFPLSERGLQTLVLAIHELCTNAYKYGALSRPGGRLSVVWDLRADADRERLVIAWTEAFAKPVVLSGRSGFGRQLIEEALPYQLGATTRFELEPEGLSCTIEIPLGSQSTFQPD